MSALRSGPACFETTAVLFCHRFNWTKNVSCDVDLDSFVHGFFLPPLLSLCETNTFRCRAFRTTHATALRRLPASNAKIPENNKAMNTIQNISFKKYQQTDLCSLVAPTCFCLCLHILSHKDGACLTCSTLHLATSYFFTVERPRNRTNKATKQTNKLFKSTEAILFVKQNNMFKVFAQTPFSTSKAVPMIDTQILGLGKQDVESVGDNMTKTSASCYKLPASCVI